MTEIPQNDHLAPLRLLLKEDRRRQEGTYGEYLHSIFAGYEREAEVLIGECAKTTDEKVLAPLVTKLISLVFKTRQSGQLIEDADSLQRITECLLGIEAQLKSVDIAAADEVYRVANFVHQKYRLLLSYLNTNL